MRGSFASVFCLCWGAWRCWPPIYACAALYAGVGVNLVFGEKWAPAVPYLQWALGMGAVQAVG